MTVAVVTPPEAGPVDLDAAREYFRVVSASEDETISALVAAAVAKVETVTGRALAEQTLRATFDRWPSGGVLPVPRPPLLSVATVEVVSPEGEVVELVAGEDYDVLTATTPGAVVLRPGRRPPISCGRPDAVRVTFTAGYGADGGPAIPETLALAVKSLALHWFENRTPVEVGTVAAPVPQTFDFLVADHRVRYRLPD